MRAVDGRDSPRFQAVSWLKPFPSKRLGVGPGGGTRRAKKELHYSQAGSVKAAGQGTFNLSNKCAKILCEKPKD